MSLIVAPRASSRFLNRVDDTCPSSLLDLSPISGQSWVGHGPAIDLSALPIPHSPSQEVPNGHLVIHTGRNTPRHDGSDDRTVGVGSRDEDRDEKGQRTESIERPTGDGVHRRAAGDAAARAAHHRPDDRPRPPSASGVPVRGCAQADSGGRGRGLRGRPTGQDSGFNPRFHHVRKPHRHFVHFRSCDCPVPSELPTGVLSTSKAAAVL